MVALLHEFYSTLLTEGSLSHSSEGFPEQSFYVRGGGLSLSFTFKRFPGSAPSEFTAKYIQVLSPCCAASVSRGGPGRLQYDNSYKCGRCHAVMDGILKGRSSWTKELSRDETLAREEALTWLSRQFEARTALDPLELTLAIHDLLNFFFDSLNGEKSWWTKAREATRRSAVPEEQVLQTLPHLLRQAQDVSEIQPVPEYWSGLLLEVVPFLHREGKGRAFAYRLSLPWGGALRVKQKLVDGELLVQDLSIPSCCEATEGKCPKCFSGEELPSYLTLSGTAEGSIVRKFHEDSLRTLLEAMTAHRLDLSPEEAEVYAERITPTLKLWLEDKSFWSFLARHGAKGTKPRQLRQAYKRTKNSRLSAVFSAA